MIVDLNQSGSLPDRAFDFCIVGGGVAGIVLALELSKAGADILLLEGGGFDFDDSSQDLYRGEMLGRAATETDVSRLRFLGGSSNHWEGRCRPLSPIDFVERDYIAHSGWPIDYSDLEPYYQQTHSIMELKAHFNDLSEDWAGDGFEKIDFNYSAPVRFGEKYRAELESSPNIHLFLNANLTDIRLREDYSGVETMIVSPLNDEKKSLTASAQNYILAMGGLENPRMLLNANSQEANGVGNGNDLVGRFFMEHFHLLAGFYAAHESNWPYGDEEINIATNKSWQIKNRLGSVCFRLEPIYDPGAGEVKDRFRQQICASDTLREFSENFTDIWCPTETYRGAAIHVVGEQVPNSQSRVMLSESRDRFGLRKLALDWRVSDQDMQSMRKATIALGVAMSHSDIASIKVQDWLLDEDATIPDVANSRWIAVGEHHMGTTRMGATAKDGVVDSDCKVFGKDNLYIAGSSVFTTGGHTNPTFTIVQLALRLADHLKEKIKNSA